MPQRKARAKASQQNGTMRKHKEIEPLTEQQKREIIDWGYTIISYPKAQKTFVSTEQGSNLIDDVLNEGSFIFNNAPNGQRGDGTRLQLLREWPNLPGQAAATISKRLEASFPHLSPGDAQILFSIANGHDQYPHTDMTAGFDQLADNPQISALLNHIKSERIPLSVIVTFSKESFLHVWPASTTTIWARKADASHEWSKYIRIPPYSALIFRQDLVHAGTKYKRDNLRLHF